MNTIRKHIYLTVIVDTLANLHWHGREIGPVISGLAREAIRGGADVLAPMPNTEEPLTTAKRVLTYIRRAKKRVPRGKKVTFLPIVMLTEDTTYDELIACRQAGIRDGKIYPYLRTTKSEHGVRKWGKMINVVRWCGELGIKVHVHFEHPNPVYINRDAEYLCLPIAELFLEETDAILIWEHGSDSRCIPAWKKMAKTGRFFVTLTAHHLACNEDEAFGDVRKKCKPPIKTEYDRAALVSLVLEDHPWVMAGPDDAAHDVNKKQVHVGRCACGDYTSPFLVQLYAHALDPLLYTEIYTKRGVAVFNNFISRNARSLHNLPPASRKLKLVRKPFKIPPLYKIGPWKVEPYGAGETIDWSLAD